MANNINSKIIAARINAAAKKYKSKLVGNTFLIIYEENYIELSFRAKNFLHLCGVDTTIQGAIPFYRKACSKYGISEKEISFSNNHPYNLADIKTANLSDAIDLLTNEILIATDIQTKSHIYALGATDLEIVMCLDKDNQVANNSNIFVPWSLRVEYLQNSKFTDLYAVDYVFKKDTNSSSGYSDLVYGDAAGLTRLPDYIKSLIDDNLLCHNC